MRSQYESSYASSALNSDTFNYNNNNNTNNNYNNSIPYHARENSLPFSYGQIKPNTTMTRRNGSSYDTMNMIDSSIISNKSRDFDFDFETNNNNNKLNGINTNSNYQNNNNIETTNNNKEMIKSQTRLTSPLLVRKTFKNPTVIKNTISNSYPYHNKTENSLLYSDDDFDSGYKNETHSHNNAVPYVTLNGTLDKQYYNNNYTSKTLNNNAFRKSPTPRNYEEFEEFLHDRREKVFNLEPRANTIRNINQNYIECVSNQRNNNNNNNKNNYDFEFNLLNLNDNDFINNKYNNNVNNKPPEPPRRNYTLERVVNSVEPNFHTLTSIKTNSSNESNWHSTLPPASSTSTYTSTLSSSNKMHSERPPLELDVGYKRHFELLQQQREQWPGYNLTNKYNNNHSGNTTTTYGNGNVAGYHNDNLSKNLSYKEADIQQIQFDSAPIYATSLKQQQQQQYKSTTTTTTTNTGKIFYDETDFYRPETPAFPVTPRTPSLMPTTTLQRETFNNNNHEVETTIYQGLANSKMNSSSSRAIETQEVAAHLVKFAKDSSQFWYKPNLSREEAIALLINATPGTFIVRDSTTYKNAYGLVLRVAQPPPGALATGKPDDLVRHFLIEPTARGVRLKGCANEPAFTSLSALVYEHSINQLALPCLLHIPEHDLLPPRTEPTPAQRQLLTQGAACNVLLLFSADTESLTGEEAIRKAIRQMYAQKPLPMPIEVHFKVTQQGITLTDNTRKRFFRKHYGTDTISYCAIDPDNRLWTMQDESQLKKTIFAFVARRSPSSKDNQCHIFCDLAVNQPASAIVSFVNKTLPTEHQRQVKL